MNEIIRIKKWPTELQVETKEGFKYVEFDGEYGEYTRSEYKQGLMDVDWSESAAEEILDALEMTSNIPFFKKSTEEIKKWLKELEQIGHGFWMMINGGEPSVIMPEQFAQFLEMIESYEYYEGATYVEKGMEYDDFKECMSSQEYDETENFLLIKHDTPYNTENQDIQIQYYEL